MGTQEKILISLVSVTIVLGIPIALGASDYGVAGRSFPWLLGTNLGNNFSDLLTFLANRARTCWDLTSLWYGGISLLALIMMGLVLRTGRDRELKALRSELDTLRGQLAEMGSAKERAENFLQEELRKKKAVLEARDSAIKAREESFSG